MHLPRHALGSDRDGATVRIWLPGKEDGMATDTDFAAASFVDTLMLLLPCTMQPEQKLQLCITDLRYRLSMATYICSPSVALPHIEPPLRPVGPASTACTEALA